MVLRGIAGASNRSYLYIPILECRRSLSTSLGVSHRSSNNMVSYVGHVGHKDWLNGRPPKDQAEMQ
jgi:hypothetical protein